MYLRKWNEALVDWVNCLALTTRIKDIGELQDGNFFRLLLQKCSSPDEGIDNEISPGRFSSVYNLLKKEFPRYGVHEIERENNTKLSYISSLLLLLSVTKGKSPMFRHHLCEDLQHESQVKIKCFLESCLQRADQLDHKYLKYTIEGDLIANEMTIPPSQTREVALAKTPMKMFFDSPRQTIKLTRDLRRLEAENEALQIENMELEDKLRIEKDKREQIEENLQMKTEQVLKLREELQEFTWNVNAHGKAEEEVTNYRTVHALKSEIRELKSHLTSLQEEKALLSEGKVMLQKKLSVFQSKNKELEIRSCYSESKNEELQIILNKRDREIRALKEQCLDLEEKIHALPLQHNMSIESDTSMHLGPKVSSPFSGGECLSYAVVDVKLAEVEEENEKLKDQIKMITEQLTGELSERNSIVEKTTQEIADYKKQLVKMKTGEKSFVESISLKERELGQLKDKLNKEESLIHSLKADQEAVIVENKRLESYIASLESKVKHLEATKQDYEVKLEVMKREKDFYGEDISLKEKELQELKETCKELEIIQREKEDLVQKVELLTTRNNLLENKLELSENTIERTKQETMDKVQKIFEGKLVKIKEKLKDHYMNDLVKFNEEGKMCKQYEESYKKYRSLATDYEKRLSDTTAQNKDLLKKVQILKEQKGILEDKLRHVKMELGTGDVQRDSLDEEGERFNATYLADLKKGKCVLPNNVPPEKRDTMDILSKNNKQSNHEASGLTSDNESSDKRFSELVRRNTLYLPHMKSSYPTEVQFDDPKTFSEDFLKGAEHGIEQGKIQSTPGRYRSRLGKGKRAVPISDSENIPVTPRTKQKGILCCALANLERNGS